MKVAIAGGGVIGLSIAWRAAMSGHDVTVADPEPGRGASWVAGGMLAPVAEAYQGEEPITALGVAAAARWSSWAEELADAAGNDPSYTQHGTLMVARDQDGLAALGPLYDVQRRQGLQAERVTSREARTLEPALAPTVRGGLWLGDDHQVDNRIYVKVLIEACDRFGVSFVPTRVETCAPHELRLVDGQTITADDVVVATGAWQPRIEMDAPTGSGASPSTELGIRPIKGQILRLRATTGAVLPHRTVRAERVYVIPRDHGEIVIGATAEEKGFDTTVTAGAVRDLLTRAWELLPGLAETELVEATAGLRPGTADNAPIIGRLGQGAGTGTILAMGHYRHGVLLSPVTADAISALLDGEPLPEVVAPFDPARVASENANGNGA